MAYARWKGRVWGRGAQQLHTILFSNTPINIFNTLPPNETYLRVDGSGMRDGGKLNSQSVCLVAAACIPTRDGELSGKLMTII